MKPLTAVTVLIVAAFAAGTTLLIFEEDVAGWVLLVAGFLAFLIVLGMVTSDANAARKS